MTRALAGLVVALTLAACAGPGVRDRRDLPLSANPSAVIAAELAFARAAQDKGQWTAFADYAADDAVMFVPEPVTAKDWLKGRANPPAAVAWQPHQVWMSCDGSLAVTKGAWQRPDGSAGYFATVWERQGRDGGYKWVLDMGDALATPLAAPEFVQARVADCNSGQAIATYDGYSLDEPAEGSFSSADGTLAYDWKVAPDGALTFEVNLIEGESMVEVLVNQVAAPAE